MTFARIVSTCTAAGKCRFDHCQKGSFGFSAKKACLHLMRLAPIDVGAASKACCIEDVGRLHLLRKTEDQKQK